MNTKILLGVSGALMIAAGIAGSFLPHEILRAIAVNPAAPLALVVQLLAAALFALGVINWTARGSLIGGIYNRAVAFGNLAHFLVGGLALLKGALAHGLTVVWIAAAVYLVFASAFTVVFFGSPLQARAASAGAE